MAGWRDTARRVAAAPARPFVRYFNRRFEDVHGHLDNETEFVNTRLEDTLATTRTLQERIATDVEVMSELTIGLERFADRLADQMDSVLGAVQQLRDEIEQLRQRT
jgi:hypothetical protein